MQPGQFPKTGFPGRLVEATIDEIAHRPDGVPETVIRTGIAFMPNPLPQTLAGLGEGVEKLLPALEQASLALGSISGYERQTADGFQVDSWMLFRPLRVREARLSSKIENTIATPTEVAMAEIKEPDRNDSAEVRNYLRASDQGHLTDHPFSESLIRQLHATMLSGIDGSSRKFPGEYRSRQVYIGDERRGFAEARFVPPPPGEVGPLMEQLAAAIANPPETIPKLVWIGLCHYQFETIHPFADGNGRIGRLLIELALTRYKILPTPLVYPSAYFEANRREYYDRLLAVSQTGDWVGWLLLFLEALRSQAADSLSRIERLYDLRAAFIDRLENRRLDRRIISAIEHLFAHPVINTASLQKLTGVSDQTARNYLKLFEQRKIVKEITGRRRNQIYAAIEVLNVSDDN